MGARLPVIPDYANASMAAASEILRDDATLVPGPTLHHRHYCGAEDLQASGFVGLSFVSWLTPVAVVSFISAGASTMVQSVYVLTSERLGFRLFEDTDLPNLKRLDMDPEVRAHFPDGISTPAQINARIARGKLSVEANACPEFAVIELDSGRFAGRAGFGPIEGGEIEVGYVFLKEFWGRGLAQESLRTLLTWARDNLTVPRVIAYAPSTHSASINVMRKAGMCLFKTDNMHGVACDFYQYSL